MANIIEIAKHAGVAPITVSRVINSTGSVSPKMKERVEAAVKELGYVPNTIARGLRSKRTNTIALIMTDITNPFFTSLARGVEDIAGVANYTVIYCNSDESEIKEEKYANMLAQRQVDGVLLVPARGNSNSIQFLKANKIDVVILDRRVPDINTDIVCSNSVDGAYRLTNLLIGLGHTHIVLITGPKDVSTSVDRVSGYRQALSEAGLLTNEFIYYGMYKEESGYELAMRAMKQNPRPTAIFGGNNFIAIGAIKSLYDQKLEVPRDVSVVGFDDLPVSMFLKPFLTVAKQHAYEMGKLATELLLKRISGNIENEHCELVLPVEILVRESVGPIRAG